MLIDSHAHINFKEYESELDDVITRSLDDKTWIINIGSNYETSQKAIEIAEKYKLGVWAVVGCHPDDLGKEEFNIDKYRQLAQSSKRVVGIGEVGLDYFRLIENADEIKIKQKEAFRRFINLAKELDLPLVLHCRGTKDDPYGAYNEMLEIFGKWHMANGKLSGVIHCYGGNLEQAKKFLNLGFYIGFTGIVTFKNAKEVQEIARQIPLNKILIETDAPFLAPEPYRGQRNEPSYVKYICQKIAELKGLSFEEVAQATYENTCRLFKL